VIFSSTSRADWPKRITLALAAGLVVAAGLGLTAWWLGGPASLHLRSTEAPLPAAAAAGLLILGLVVLLHEQGFRTACWLALVPAGIGVAAFFRPAQPVVEGMAVTLAAGLVLVGGGFSLLALPRRPARRTLTLAIIGSLVASIGASTALGYALELRAIYRWSHGPVTDPMSALSLVLLGLTTLGVAWCDRKSSDRSAPPWLPLPVVVGSVTLTLILWVGLRQREIEYLGSTTQSAVNNLASTLNLELEKQSNLVERIARRWSQTDSNEVVWEVDAVTHQTESGACLSLALVQLNGVTSWLHPISGNEYLAGLDHTRDPVRAAALEQVRRLGVRVVSGTLDLPTVGPGFALYAPVYRQGQLWGFVGADYSYAGLLAELVQQRLKLSTDYRTQVSIGDRLIYTSGLGTPLSLSDQQGIEMVFTLFDRRVRIHLTPSEALSRRLRRFLPELTLAAGFGITVLLGLSVHLSRSAYTSLRRAESSNRQLQEENEERRRVEAMLKVSDERLRLALDSTLIGIFEWNLGTNVVYYSPGLSVMLGYAPEELQPQPEAWTALIHPEDLPAYRRDVESQLAGERGFIEPEYRIRSGRGDWRWLYARAKTVARAPSGAPLRIIGTLQDITDRKLAEGALRTSQAEARKLSLVASRTDNLVIIGTPDGRVDWVNESFTRVMEYSLAEIRGQSPASFMAGPETSARTVRRIAAAMHRGVGLTCDVVTYSKSGRQYHVGLEIQPVRNEAGEIETFIAILADITSRVETERALRRAKREADNASRAKSEFLASMSHEIRTPMNGVIGMTALLLETRLDLEQRDYVSTIRTSGEALLNIINDILDFSKIESGKMELEHLPFELAVCVEETLELFAMQSAAKKLELGYDIAADVPPWLVGDVTRLRQVLVNLVNNAVKFTPNGSISIEVRRLARLDVPSLPPDRLMLEIRVTDTGIGIPEERLERLFKPFSQVDSSTTRKYGGTGLGLAICQQLALLMGGGIRVESQVNHGSSFIVTAMVAPGRPSHAVPPLTIPASLRSSYVLGISESEIVQRRFATLFQSWDVTYQPASSASAALQILRRNPPPALVLFDHDLLTMADGPRLVLRIDEQRLPTILLLAPGQSSAQTAFQRPHVVPLSKPTRTASLLRSLHKVLKTEVPLSERVDAADQLRTLGDELPLEVLLVEDNVVNQKVALRFLGRLGYRAEAVGNGVEALATLEHRHFDLILMDLQMPEMDGCEASRRIRAQLPPHRQPKIIALTANALQGDRELCLAAGMDDYISKPVKLAELGETIRRQFSPPAGNAERARGAVPTDA
jgi:PAS domain S-box-containing protein